MSKLSWVTPTGTVASVLVGVPVTFNIQVVDSANTGSTVTYSVISGSLPTGLTLSTSGVISGTASYTALGNNYLSSQTYSFIIRAIASDLTVLDGAFNIIVDSTVNADFVWATPGGTLGTVPNGAFYSLLLAAEDTLQSPITYSLISGALPDGMQIVSQNFTANTALSTSQLARENTLIFANTDLIQVGDFVFGNGIATGSKVITVDSITDPAKTTVTLNLNTTSYLPSGTAISFYTPGTLQGVPTILNPLGIDQSQEYRFSIRAINGLGHVRDQSFSLTITNVYGPVIEPTVPLLGDFFDGKYFSQTLNVPELNPNAQIEWKVVNGSLPPGLSITSSGTVATISGYILPLELVGAFGPEGYDADTVTEGVVTAQQEYDHGPYDFNNINQSKAYNFTVQAYDGANYDLQDYIINVISRSNFTTNSTDLVNDTYLTIDATNTYQPVLLDTSTTLPTARQDSYYAYKFQGYDFQNDTITYSLSVVGGTFDGDPFDPLAENPGNNGLAGSFDHVGNSITTNLPGLLLDAASGWLYGKVSPQVAALEEFKFGVVVSKVANVGTTVDNVTTYADVTISSDPVYFTLPVLGDINNTITWVSSANLGTVNNGQVSELAVQAQSTEGKDLVYSLVDQAGYPCRLPQGLTLLPSGDISGRVSFEAFSIDNYATTFDGNKLSIDRTYQFWVQAATVDGTATSTQKFTLTLDIVDNEPYNNLYLKALPSVDQRNYFNSIINNTEIFDPAIIYRPLDPWYGVQTDIRMLFLAGLNDQDLAVYQTAMLENHFNKTYDFGNIKTAVVLDEVYNTKYEVVYVEVVDPELNSAGVGPGLEIDLTNTISNPYIDAAGNTFKILYPNTSTDMINRIVNSVGYQDQSSLPSWMTSNQIGTGTNKFNPPLGYTKAVVLAYTVPGKGAQIVYRLNSAGVNFSNINFTVDRYQVDSYYSTNYNYQLGDFSSGTETTFDQSAINLGSVSATVNYGVTIPFDQINGRPVSYINTNGGIDGVTKYKSGDTLIFIKQQTFVNAGPYDGWVNYVDAYLGDNITSTPIEGYDSESYDQYTVIPGYLEKLSGTATVNQRGGIWKINIVNGIVNLSFVQEVVANELIRVLSGTTYISSIVYYNNQNLAPGESVPRYTIYNPNTQSYYTALKTKKPTTFNNGTTRFFSYRDQYYTPGSQDKYLKFPQYGAFN